jgi:DNA-binding MarR family transcriptional regulator
MTTAPQARVARLRALLPEEEDPTAPLLGALLRLGADRVQRHLMKRLAAAGFDDLGRAHLVVLRYPPPDGERPSDLARRANMTKQAMNYLLGQLEEMGYVRRPTARATSTRVVSLTERGWRVSAFLRREVRALEKSWSARLGAKRFESFLGVLRDIYAFPEG